MRFLRAEVAGLGLLQREIREERVGRTLLGAQVAHGVKRLLVAPHVHVAGALAHALTLLVATASTRWVEEPLLRLREQARPRSTTVAT